MKKILLCIVLLLPLMSGKAYAEDVVLKAADIMNVSDMTQGLDESEKSVIGEQSFDGSFDISGAIGRLCRELIRKLGEALKGEMSFALTLTALSLISSFCSSVCDNKKISQYAELTGCGGCAVILIGSMGGIISSTVDAMYRLSDYSKAALPVVFTAAAASGAVTSSGARFAAVCFALDVLLSISQKLIIPVIYAFLALNVSDCLFPNPLLGGMSRLTKWTATTMMTGMTIAFTAYISMTGVVTGAVDAAAVKTARTVISNALPVVGGMISDASAAVLSAAGVIRSCTGVTGLIAICAICVGPFAILSVKLFILKAAASLSEAMESRRIASLFSGMSAAMGLMMGLLGSCGIILFISMTAAMKAVSG